ncbi:hypothetical protein AVEN_158129-1 [Araneus ventricosus]|uniref:Uncharacterized protein n=1 Tax=Araneus ventricosus TaxID=182803 RepID=A0A4Y2HS21_ARAVE|nr:hypothetical protein AVEN_158129-1 [Araneus ventricosus]
MTAVNSIFHSNEFWNFNPLHSDVFSWHRLGRSLIRSRIPNRRVPGSKPNYIENPPCVVVRIKSDTVGQMSSRRCDAEVWREGCQLGCRNSHLTAVQNYEVRPKYSPRVASKRDLNITKLRYYSRRCIGLTFLDFDN